MSITGLFYSYELARYFAERGRFALGSKLATRSLWPGHRLAASRARSASAPAFLISPLSITKTPCAGQAQACPCRSLRRGGDSVLTEPVQVSYFLGAKLLENILDLFESPSQRAQARCSSPQLIRCAHFVCGEGEIRTPETLASLPLFESGAFNHSATSPDGARITLPFFANLAKK